ncbi:ABC transporter ATP-binding protein [Kiloniella laminariae]|uniref:ABC transporter ATP-binding protein n=1 Tax=Kiloniella laminariae TaxID=454162 RepID=A0ABT4LJ63_9PROT|nr:ABC transporter ATP-binding protein [Kiloniella laminariae]MCZ4281152.1 ABC transporter ATP-binding protein [Kiloniella laminariae]
MNDLLRIKNLRVSFRLPEGELNAVRGVSFRIPKGKTVALVGESGSGKSVVSQAIMGILPRAARISDGEILFADPQTPGTIIDLAKLDPDGTQMRQIRGGRISMVFQEPMTSLSPVHTVGNQICEALELHRAVNRTQGMALTTDILKLVGFPNPERAAKTFPFELSGGLRQRAVIAMALVCHPVLLIADEPTTALDVTIQAQILKLIKDLQIELEMSVLMITHDLGVVANMADEVVVMYHGEIMESGTAEDIFRNPKHPYLKALLEAVPRFDMKPDERLKPIREIKHHPDNPILTAKRDRRVICDDDPPLLEVKNISKAFSIKKGGMFSRSTEEKVLAVDDISFFVRRGECLGLVGESGCGKTTLSKIIMRALKPDTGSITFREQDNSLTDVLALEKDALFKFRERVQFMFQDPYSSLNPRMTVQELIGEPLFIHGMKDKAQRRDMVEKLMDVVGLAPMHINRYPHSFSGGQRQRIGIARALALQPDLLICDEPVSALDVSIQAQVLNLLKDLKEALGLTYIFISHNLAVIDYVADRIMVMCQGRLVETAPKQLLFKNPVHPYTRALLSAVPEPDLDHPLDLRDLMEGKASNPADWPEPYTENRDNQMAMIHLGQGHYVRAFKGAETLLQSHKETEMV